jgi:2C-methyl-D-erythritol 2,4-cyclodiphosphate synthase
MNFVYFNRKAEDIDLHRKLTKDKRDLGKVYNEKRSNYDKNLTEYNKLIRKLDNLKDNSLEYKNTKVDIEVYAEKLKNDEKKTEIKADIEIKLNDVVIEREGIEVKNIESSTDKKKRAPRQKKVLIIDD